MMFTPLTLAIHEGDLETAFRLLNTTDPSELKLDEVTCVGTALTRACNTSDDNLDLIELILEKGAYIDARNHHGCTAFLLSCQHGNVPAIKFLASKGADTNLSEGKLTPLFWFMSRIVLYNSYNQGHKDVLDLLIANGAEKYTCKETFQGQEQVRENIQQNYGVNRENVFPELDEAFEATYKKYNVFQ